MNIEEFQNYGKELIEFICKYIRTLEEKRVTASVEPGYLRQLVPNEAPMEPESFNDIMKDFTYKIMPGVRVF